MRILDIKLNNTPTYYLGDGNKSKLTVPRLVWGTSGLGGVWGAVNEMESVDTLVKILGSGDYAVDTSPSYARAQEYLGKAIKYYGARDLPFISTKVGRLQSEDPHNYIMDYSTEGLRTSFYNSLKVLNVDKVDLVFLHEPHLVPMDEMPRILDDLNSFRKEGLVNYLGIGGNLTKSILPYAKNGEFDAVSGFLKMNACNLDFFRSNDKEVIEECGLVYYNSSILHFGLLGNRIPYYMDNFRQQSKWLTRTDVDNALWLRDFAVSFGVSMVELAIRYALSIKEANRIVLGGKNHSQYKSTEAILSKGPLSYDMFHEITSHIMCSWNMGTDS